MVFIAIHRVQELLGSKDVGLDYLFHTGLFYRSWTSIYVKFINFINLNSTGENTGAKDSGVTRIHKFVTRI